MSDLPPITDCHCHIMPKWLAHQQLILRGVLRRCARYNVCPVVSVDCSCGAAELDLDLLGRLAADAGVRHGVSLGFEPPATEADLASLPRRLEQATATMRQLATRPEVVAVGEVGLDHHWPVELILKDREGNRLEGKEQIFERCLDIQVELFKHWIELARQLHLPLVVHEREAHAEARWILDACALAPQRVMFHCFGSTADNARAAAAHGYWISIPSSVVFRRQYREVAAAVDLAQVLVETDSPYHSPFQGLWKICMQQAEAELEGGGRKSKAHQQALSTRRAELFFDSVQETLPGLQLDLWKNGAPRRVAADPHLRTSKARYQNEPTFVRYAAQHVARIQGLEPQAACATLQRNALRFYGLDGPQA